MKVAIVTGSGGLVGSAVVRQLASLFDVIVGIDNDQRRRFFGPEASVGSTVDALQDDYLGKYSHYAQDIRYSARVDSVFDQYGADIQLVVHCAAQPSHDWAGQHPVEDFQINAGGTLNMLEATRRFSPQAHFIFLSTNKVYGDRVNYLPFEPDFSRWDLPSYHRYHNGIDEDFSIDSSTHSPFGVSKAAADLMVQEYGNYYDLNVTVLRAGCMTGAAHQGAQLHGFLAYLLKCIVTGAPYTVYGYGAKQVRDNIDARDVAAIIQMLYEADGGTYAVYNIGGERANSISMQEAIWRCEALTGNKISWHYDETPRVGDHKWWITNMGRFRSDFPAWEPMFTIDMILRDMYATNAERWLKEAAQ